MTISNAELIRIANSDRPDSISTMGIKFITEHPFRTAFQPAAQTITGKSLTERSQEIPISGRPDQPVRNFLKATGRDIAAYGADLISTPTSVATLGLGQLKGVQQIGKTISGTKVGQNIGRALSTPAREIPRNIGRTVTAPYRYVKDLIQRPEIIKKEAEAAKFALGRKIDITVHGLGKKSTIQQSIRQKDYESINRGYDELSGTLKKGITKEAHKESLNLQEELPKLFRKKSVEYGQKLNSLVKDKNITVSGDDVVSSIQDSLVQKGVLRFDPEAGIIIKARSPITAAEKEVYGLYEGTLKQLIDNPGARVDIEDIMRVQKFSKPKFGKTWTSDDMLRADFSEKMSGFIDDSVEGIKGLKREFRPYLEWKKQAIKELKPFSGEFETGAATKLISKVGSKDLKPDEASLLSNLEQQLSRQVGGRVKTYQKGLQTIEEKQLAVKQEANQVLGRMKQEAKDVAFKLRQDQKFTEKDITDAAEKLIKKYRYKRIKAGIGAGIVFTGTTGGNLLKYFFRREIYSGIHGGY